MAVRGAPCAFCVAARALVLTAVLDEKWSRRYGGTPAVALDHGWYTSATGQRVAVGQLGSAKPFSPLVRSCCDQCVTGWIEDLHWRAEPALLAMAERRALPPAPRADLTSVMRWAQLTAMLAELVPGMPTASSSMQRQAVRQGVRPLPSTSTWLFTLRQRLPARVHLSQVSVREHVDDQVARSEGLLQIVSFDVAHVSALVVIPSNERAELLVAQSALGVELGTPLEAVGQPGPASVRELDLARTPHPHRIAVHRLCARSGGPHRLRGDTKPQP